MSKTIMISNEMYSKLKTLKGKNSFTEIIKKVLEKNDVKRGSELKECLGILKKDEEWKRIDKTLKRGWKDWSRKYV